MSGRKRVHFEIARPDDLGFHSRDIVTKTPSSPTWLTTWGERSEVVANDVGPDKGGRPNVQAVAVPTSGDSAMFRLNAPPVPTIVAAADLVSPEGLVEIGAEVGTPP
jgi:hypothetical protein